MQPTETSLQPDETLKDEQGFIAELDRIGKHVAQGLVIDSVGTATTQDPLGPILFRNDINSYFGYSWKIPTEHQKELLAFFRPGFERRAFMYLDRYIRTVKVLLGGDPFGAPEARVKESPEKQTITEDQRNSIANTVTRIEAVANLFVHSVRFEPRKIANSAHKKDLSQVSFPSHDSILVNALYILETYHELGDHERISLAEIVQTEVQRYFERGDELTNLANLWWGVTWLIKNLSNTDVAWKANIERLWNLIERDWPTPSEIEALKSSEYEMHELIDANWVYSHILLNALEVYKYVLNNAIEGTSDQIRGRRDALLRFIKSGYGNLFISNGAPNQSHTDGNLYKISLACHIKYLYSCAVDAENKERINKALAVADSLSQGLIIPDHRFIGNYLVWNTDKITLKTVDTTRRIDNHRREIIDLTNQLRRYKQKGNYDHPFNILLCAPPGTGKSFFVKEICGHCIKPKTVHTVNLSQVSRKEDVLRIFENLFPKPKKSRGSIRPTDEIQVVFFDEVDSKMNDCEIFSWLLMPMWDRLYVNSDGDITSLPPLVFFFALSKWISTELFAKTAQKGDIEKGRDFISRIDKRVDLLGLSDPATRILMASSNIARKMMAGGIRPSARISAEVLIYFGAREFEYNSREMEKVLEHADYSSQFFQRSNLPAAFQNELIELLGEKFRSHAPVEISF